MPQNTKLLSIIFVKRLNKDIPMQNINWDYAILMEKE